MIHLKLTNIRYHPRETRSSQSRSEVQIMSYPTNKQASILGPIIPPPKASMQASKRLRFNHRGLAKERLSLAASVARRLSSAK